MAEETAQKAQPNRNKDGLIPGQRVSPKELSEVKQKQRQRK